MPCICSVFRGHKKSRYQVTDNGFCIQRGLFAQPALLHTFLAIEALHQRLLAFGVAGEGLAQASGLLRIFCGLV